MSDTTRTGAAAPPDAAEIATIRSDPNRWHYGERIENDDPILRARGATRGLALYDEVERDPQVGCELGKRRMALLGREWDITAGAEDPRAVAAADLVKRALAGARFNQAVEKLLDAILKGLAVCEVMWVRRAAPGGGVEIVPAELRGRDPRRFRPMLPPQGVVPPEGEPPPAFQLRLLSRDNPTEGDPLPERKFVAHRFGARYENPWGLGLGARLFWPVFFKRQGIGFWLSALEKFGQPTALGKYPAGASADDQAKLLDALQAIASEAGVIVPEGMAVQLLEANRVGTFDSYEGLARYMDEDISKVILGQTLTTSAGASGSRALGQVHNEVRLELTKGDADLLSDTLNGSLLRWIVDLNMPGYAATGLAYPSLWWDVSEPEDLAARADRDTKVKQLGYRPTDDYVRETYGEGWERDAPAPPPPPSRPADPVAALFAEAGQRGRRRGRMPPADDPRDAADDLADQLDTIAADAQDALIAAVRGAIFAEEVTSLDQARDRLVQLFPSMPVAGLAELLGQAFAVATLAGRADQADGD